MRQKEKSKYILEEMEKLFPDGESELANWETPFQFLICIILSAQTTDSQVNKVTGGLFDKYPTALVLSNALEEDIQKIIGSVNYFRAKSRYIIETAGIIVEEFDCEVPKNVDDLLKLKGVGRKTANVYLNNMYKSNQGIGADTHIIRVSQRLGLSKETSPEGVASDLERLYDKGDWYKVNNLFVLYGRYYCKARVKPDKSECIFEFCSYCSS
jgi:endonuclease-3